MFDIDSFLIQHDWQETKPKEKFFVGRKNFGEQKSRFQDIFLNNNANFEVKATDNETPVYVERISPSKLLVKWPTENDRQQEVVFVAPAEQFTEVHSTPVNSVDVSILGRLAVSGGCDGELQLWNLRDGKIKHSLVGHVLDVNTSRFFPSGEVVLSGGMDMSVRMWCSETGQCVRTLNGHTRAVHDLAFIGEGAEVLSCAGDGTIRRWCCSTGTLINTIAPVSTNASVNAITLDNLKDPKLVCCATETGQVVGFDVANSYTEVTYISLFITQNTNVNAVPANCTAICMGKFVNSDPNRMEDDSEMVGKCVCFVGTGNGEIHAFDTTQQVPLARLRTNCGRVTKLDFVKEHLIASFADGSLKIISSPSGNSPHVVNELSGSDCEPINDFSTSLPGLLLSGGRDKTLRTYNLFL